MTVIAADLEKEKGQITPGDIPPGEGVSPSDNPIVKEPEPDERERKKKKGEEEKTKKGTERKKKKSDKDKRAIDPKRTKRDPKPPQTTKNPSTARHKSDKHTRGHTGLYSSEHKPKRNCSATPKRKATAPIDTDKPSRHKRTEVAA